MASIPAIDYFLVTVVVGALSLILDPNQTLLKQFSRIGENCGAITDKILGLVLSGCYHEYTSRHFFVLQDKGRSGEKKLIGVELLICNKCSCGKTHVFSNTSSQEIEKIMAKAKRRNNMGGE